jgi:hypothetical protein
MHLSRNYLRSTLRLRRGVHGVREDCVDQCVRVAQASEIFRSAFLKSSGASVTISTADLDQLVAEERVRPSLMLGAFESLGSVSGMVCRLAPDIISSRIGRVVQQATQNQFNNCIRSIHENKDGFNSNNAVKECLKYHRDLLPQQEGTTDDKTKPLEEALSAALTSVLGLSNKL